LILIPLILGGTRLFGTELPCTVCAGVRVGDPARVLHELELKPRLGDNDVLFVSWTSPLDGTADVVAIDAVRQTGATPWLRVVFRTPQPITTHLDQFEAELESLIVLVQSGGDGLFVQALWQPENGPIDASEHAFLIKKAAVAVTGSSPTATFIAGPQDTDPDSIRALYREGVAAYLDLVALPPGDDLVETMTALSELDAGKRVVLDALPMPGIAVTALIRVAEAAASGVAVTFFDAVAATSVDLAPLKVMAHEFQGDLVFDHHSNPTGAGDAWAFVREDLGLRVIAEPPPDAGNVELLFADAWLRSPTVIDLGTGEGRPVHAVSQLADGLAVTLDDPGKVLLLRLERSPIEEHEAFDQQIDVGADREIPVEEILRRLQAFEDDQARRFEHYEATRSLHLRFQTVQGSFEASYVGDFFYHRDHGSDWVWRDFFAGGVRWKSKNIPKVPLIQPEKVASLPAEIQLTEDYDYRLRGTETVDGRNCWAIDFKPINPAPGRSLFRGTVWVDQQIYARVRTRATQVGLEGSVLSSETALFYTPLDRNGASTGWHSESYVIPTKILGQQTLSVLSVTLPIEVETEIADVRFDGENFDSNRAAALASEATMLRDTDDGFRYLKKDKTGQRYVETQFDSDRLFLVGGVFWDESLEFPLPLAGVNYLDLDVKGTGTQFDVFFAGALLNAGFSDPSLFGSRFNGGVNINGIFIKTNDRLYRDGVVVPEEDVMSWSTAGDLFIGRPLGDNLSFEVNYGLERADYSSAEDAAPDFVIPQDTFIHSFRSSLDYNRSGYRLRLAGDANRRSNWEFWGLPGNLEYDPDQEEFLRWRATLAKTWWLSSFRRIGLSAEYLNGSNLDRFSGYDFGLFGNSVVAGYSSGLVRAERASGVHLTYGINILEQIRFDAKIDAVWATNRSTALDNELLAGIGVQGTMTLPWQLITNFEVGYAFAGPGKGGVALRVFFLRLFPGR